MPAESLKYCDAPFCGWNIKHLAAFDVCLSCGCEPRYCFNAQQIADRKKIHTCPKCENKAVVVKSYRITGKS